jgi:hypothetical protein
VLLETLELEFTQDPEIHTTERTSEGEEISMSEVPMELICKRDVKYNLQDKFYFQGKIVGEREMDKK